MALVLDTFEEQVEALYIAYFGRAGEPDGFDYWVGRLQSGQMTFAQVASSFASQPEALLQHPYLSNPASASSLAFIESLYAQLLNRAPDAEGLAYWTASLSATNGDPIKIGLLIAQFISGANVANGDAATIQNQIDAALYFTTEFKAAGIGGTTNGSTLDPKYLAIARDVVDNEVTSNPASIQTSRDEVDAFLAPPPSGGSGGGSTPPGPEPIGSAVLTLSADAATVAERSGETAVATFTLTRSGNVSIAVTVDFQVSGYGESAASADDFEGGVFPSGSISFAPGETEKTISVSIAGDRIVETSEAFQVSISSTNSNVAISNSSASVTIVDDDQDRFTYVDSFRSSHQMSDDGTVIAQPYSGNSLAVYRGEDRFLYGDERRVEQYSVSDDGSTVAFSFYDTQSGDHDIALARADGSVFDLNFNLYGGAIHFLQVSNDGSAIIFGHGSNPSNVDLFYHDSYGLRNYGNLASGSAAPLLSGDGTAIAFNSREDRDNSGSDGDNDGDIFILRFLEPDGSLTQVQRVTSVQAGQYVEIESISDDGSRLVYSVATMNENGQPVRELFLSGEPQPIVTLSGSQQFGAVRISDDGSHVAYLVQAGSGSTTVSDLWVYDVANNTSLNLTANDDRAAITFGISDDGKTIVFDLVDYPTLIEISGTLPAEAPGVADVYIYDGTVTHVTSGANHVSANTQISGDGSTIGFASLATNLGAGVPPTLSSLQYLVTYDYL